MQSSQIMPGPLLRQSRLRVGAQPRAVRCGLALVAVAALGGSLVLAGSTPDVNRWSSAVTTLALSLAPSLSPSGDAETTAATNAARVGDTSDLIAVPVRVPLDPVLDGDPSLTTTAAPAPTELAVAVEAVVVPEAAPPEAAASETAPPQPAPEAVVAAPTRPRLQVTATNGLLLYSQPRSDSALVTTLPSGATVEELPADALTASQGWRHVVWNDREGWAAGYLLRSAP